MAAFGFGTLGRLVLLGTVAPGFYLVISQGAAERARVESLDRAIVQARRDIRDLETEFDTRANMAQLERWNGDVLSLAAPRAEQFVGGETQLASLPGRTEGGNVALAYVVPAAPADYVAPETAPVPGSQPASPQPAAATAVAVRPTRAPAIPAVAAPVQSASVRSSAPPRNPAATRKAQAVAMLDRTLLSDATLGDLSRKARVEASARP